MLGSGVIGVTSAWYLAQAGHEVVVVDRQPGPALETSFANAGEISFGLASPWAAPDLPLKVIRWMFMRHSPLIIRPRLELSMARWLLGIARNANKSRYAANKHRMVRLSAFSRECLIELRSQAGIDYDEGSRGTLQLFRKHRQLDDAGRDVEVLKSEGIPFQVLDRAGCISVEPGLAYARDPFVGGLRFPLDETGDCFKFTTELARLSARQGVTFLFGRTIERLIVERRSVAKVATDAGDVCGDAFLVALGSYSPVLLSGLIGGVSVYPVKGYSMTIPLSAATHAPLSTVMDDTLKVAITRLGDRIRVGGLAEICGFDTRLSARRRATLELSFESLFPASGDLSRATIWCGLRPMTPDGVPIVGTTPLQNLFLNTGHGTLGWTMACGSGHAIADIISGRRPETDVSALGLQR